MKKLTVDDFGVYNHSIFPHLRKLRRLYQKKFLHHQPADSLVQTGVRFYSSVASFTQNLYNNFNNVVLNAINPFSFLNHLKPIRFMQADGIKSN